ncbi:uncharacterized protein LOC126282320 [Schistocerca gregaria]|uniref:uncharacterized protein LOC126282320 n=1 Tax=Schistocerca gregaria TaxID=7010 RepID=UPI00211F173A|nr:uncharacterized protein LOC126282320 [Schistocerca gregaria]
MPVHGGGGSAIDYCGSVRGCVPLLPAAAAAAAWLGRARRSLALPQRTHGHAPRRAGGGGGEGAAGCGGRVPATWSPGRVCTAAPPPPPTPTTASGKGDAGTTSGTLFQFPRAAAQNKRKPPAGLAGCRLRAMHHSSAAPQLPGNAARIPALGARCRHPPPLPASALPAVASSDAPQEA